LNALASAGFRVLSACRFPNRYKAKWVNGQLDMAVRRLPRVANHGLARSLASRVETLRGEGLALCAERNGLRCGADYVVACEPN